MTRKEPGRARRGLAWLVAPPQSLRLLREAGGPRLASLLARRLVLVALAVVGVGVVLGTHAAHQPLYGLARQVVLVLGAALVLLLSGRLAPQMRLLSRWTRATGRQWDETRGGRVLRVLARLSAPPPPSLDEEYWQKRKKDVDV